MYKWLNFQEGYKNHILSEKMWHRCVYAHARILKTPSLKAFQRSEWWQSSWSSYKFVKKQMYTMSHTETFSLHVVRRVRGSFAQSMLVLQGGRWWWWCWLLHDGAVDDRLDVVTSVSGVNHTLPLAILQLLLSKDAIETHVWCLRLDDSIHTKKKKTIPHKKSVTAFRQRAHTSCHWHTICFSIFPTDTTSHSRG